MNIAVMVPTRGRPQNIVELIAAWADTATLGGTHMVICVDRDDPCFDQYEAIERPPWVFMFIGAERQRLGTWLNKVGPTVAVTADVVGFMGDDHRPRTKNWDGIVRQHFLDTVNGVMYGNDLIQGRLLPTAVFMDARIVRTLGWFTVPDQIHLFMDNTWKKLGEELGTLHYEPDMVIEHLHPIANKAQWDQTYIEANDGGVGEHDRELFETWVAGDMKNDIERIRNA